MTVRIAMWSGPRNISTAMMRAFENRPDTAVIDEPFYGPYLVRSGVDHPLREAVLAAHATDAEAIAAALTGPAPHGAQVFYQKHMTHHMLPGVTRAWMGEVRSAFLIREPRRVLASYAARRAAVELDDIGFAAQARLFDEVCDLAGAAPPVIDAEDVLGDPRAVLGRLCAALDIHFAEDMLAWPAGPRASDGAWAPAWYDAVIASTGFGPPAPEPAPLEPHLEALARAVRPHYERLARYRI
jgi:hypothetical protein